MSKKNEGLGELRDAVKRREQTRLRWSAALTVVPVLAIAAFLASYFYFDVQRLTAARAEIVETRAALAQARKRLATQETRFARELGKLNSDKAAAQIALKREQARLSAARAELAQSQRAIKAGQTDLARGRKELDEQKKKAAAELARTRQSHDARLQAAAAALAETRQTLNGAVKEQAEIRTQRDAAIKDNAELQTKLDQALKVSADLRNKLSASGTNTEKKVVAARAAVVAAVDGRLEPAQNRLSTTHKRLVQDQDNLRRGFQALQKIVANPKTPRATAVQRVTALRETVLGGLAGAVKAIDGARSDMRAASLAAAGAGK